MTDTKGLSTGRIVVSLPILMILGGFFALTLYNGVEITFAIFSTFRRYRGLYFWSMLIATAALPFYVLGFILKFFELTDNWTVNWLIIVISWICLVTGQNIVLWSRLGLVVPAKRKIRWLLVLIIVDAFILHVPTSVLFYLANVKNPKQRWVMAYATYEKIQITGFSIQEAVIAGTYVYYAWKMLKPMTGTTAHRGRPRRLLLHLVSVNILVVVMDATMLGTQYADEYMIQTPYKGFLYSVKLKFEFYVLNQLFAFLHRAKGPAATDDIHTQPSFTGRLSGPSLSGFGTGTAVGTRPTVTTDIKHGDDTFECPLQDRIMRNQEIKVEVERGPGEKPGSAEDEASSHATSSSSVNFAGRGG